VVVGTSPEPKTAFVLAFDRQTLKLVALERYGTRDAAMPALFRHNDDGEFATVVEAESEATLRSTRDLEEIARELRQSWERGEAELMHIASIIAGLAYPERRVLELCDPMDGLRLTNGEAAAEIGCSVRTVRRLRQQGWRNVMTRLDQTGFPNADRSR
jgi:DNA-directed RNA polymerase specialized sigma24 family protein